MCEQTTIIFTFNKKEYFDKLFFVKDLHVTKGDKILRYYKIYHGYKEYRYIKYEGSEGILRDIQTNVKNDLINNKVIITIACKISEQYNSYDIQKNIIIKDIIKLQEEIELEERLKKINNIKHPLILD